MVLRDVGQTFRKQPVGRKREHALARQPYLAVPLARHIVDTLEQGGLAGAILADHGDDLSGCDLEIDPVDDQPAVAVADAETAHIENGLRHPRYASITSGLACTSAG